MIRNPKDFLNVIPEVHLKTKQIIQKVTRNVAALIR